MDFSPTASAAAWDAVREGAQTAASTGLLLALTGLLLALTPAQTGWGTISPPPRW